MVITYNNWSYNNARFALIIKAKVPESSGDIHNYGKHPTPQKINAYIVNKNSGNEFHKFSLVREAQGYLRPLLIDPATNVSIR